MSVEGDIYLKPFLSGGYTGMDHLIHDRTTYSTMNAWHTMREPTGVAHPRVPTTNTGRSGVRPSEWTGRDSIGQKADLEYKRAYTDLTSKIAYLHPNPGKPRIRQGCIGGTWRHIKEVQGHRGTNVVYVDGLVSLYDSGFNRDLQAQLPSRPHIANPRYTPTYRDLDSYQQRDVSGLQTSGYLPSLKVPGIPTAGKVSSWDGDVLRKVNLQRTGKSKGVYRYK